MNQHNASGGANANGRRWLLGGLAVVGAVGIGAGVALSQDGAEQIGTATPTTDTVATTLEDDSTDSSLDDGEGEGDGGGASDANGNGSNNGDVTGDADDAAGETGSDDNVAPVPGTNPRYVFANGAYVGAWDGNAWADGPVAPGALDGLSATSPSGLTSLSVQDAEFCYNADGSLSLESSTLYGEPIAATGIDGALLASAGQSISPAPVHVEVVATQLQAAGLDVPVNITDVRRVDLQNDGVDEVLIVASSGEPHFYGSRVGDYSMLILRRVDDVDNVENIVLRFSATTGNEPGIQLAEDLYDSAESGIYTQYVSYSSLPETAFADLNGDGVMEIVVEPFIYEGWGTEVFDTQLPGVPVVLESACGV